MRKPTKCFTNTVDDYLKYRPTYPKEVLQLLIEDCEMIEFLYDTKLYYGQL